MSYAQPGIFALGDASHGYFEFALLPGADRHAFVTAIADLRAPHTTVGGANIVVGYRPDFWRDVAPDAIPEGVRGFDAPLVGPDGYAMPATQADAIVWYAAAAYDIVFDLGSATVAALSPYARLARESTGWSYKHSRDLTGFEDGTENPTLFEAPAVALVPDGAPGAGGSVLLFQQWRHKQRAWDALDVRAQERVIGRSKAESIEFDDDAMPHNAHVARTKYVVDGEELAIFRRSSPYGNVGAHGLLFAGFAGEQIRLHAMLEQMAGIGGPRDAITHYSEPLTGAYYFCPSLDDLARFRAPDDEEAAAAEAEAAAA